MNIEDLEGLNDEVRKEIKDLLNVTRKKYDEEAYAEAQFSIGSYLGKNGYKKEALYFWKNVKRLENPPIYAQAQYNIGTSLLEMNDLDAAILALNNVEQLDHPLMYTYAQNNIGSIYHNLNDMKRASFAWANVQREYSPNLYALAQLNIGALLKENGDIEAALSAWSNIRYEDNPLAYAQSKLNAGIALRLNGNSEEALLAYSSVKYEDDPKSYASAQLNIGVILLDEKNNLEAALSAWQKVKRRDNPEAYAYVRLNLGGFWESRKNIKEALSNWGNVKHTDDEKLYAIAQLRMGKLRLKNIKDAIPSEMRINFDNAKEFFSYESYCYLKISPLLTNKDAKSIGEKYLEIFERVLYTVDILKIKFIDDRGRKLINERKLAHYTSSDVANILLTQSEQESRLGSFRLNTVSKMNDPSEGRLLSVFLNDEKNMNYLDASYNDRLHAFFSCFTFNHNSLNQFRLYGKKDNKEASGVSLVFKQDFFQYDEFRGFSFLSFDPSVQERLVKENDLDILNDKSNTPKDHMVIDKQPIIRCVYIDPDSDYIHLAQRNRITFYQEFGNEKVTIKEDSIEKERSKAEVKWQEYRLSIERRTEAFKNSFEDLKESYKELIERTNDLKKRSPKTLDGYEELLDEILLPLKYLIKHAAFEEEQECRMMYITSLEDEKVKRQEGYIFVEYEPNVKTHIDKVYIAPAATQYQPYLAKLLCDTDVKIELSNNPYRQA